VVAVVVVVVANGGGGSSDRDGCREVMIVIAAIVAVKVVQRVAK